VRSAGHKAPRHTLFNTPFLPRLSQAQMSSSALYSRKSVAYFTSSLLQANFQIIVWYILIFIFLDSEMEYQKFSTE